MQEISGYIRIIPRLFTHSLLSDLVADGPIKEIEVPFGAISKGGSRNYWIGLSKK